MSSGNNHPLRGEPSLFPEAISVLELNQRLSDAVAVAPDVHNVWVVGETSDVRRSGGHCYLELVDKGADGSNVSRIRAIIWAGAYNRLTTRFFDATNVAFASGIKVRVLVSASYHPAYGMSVNITDIDPAYTLGDAARLRAEIVKRLTSEGIIDLNKQLPWPLAPNRLAVISAKGAAGYGDFITHLFSHPARLRFSVELFPAVMQGERTVPTVMEALENIARQSEKFDTVVIIRGGGSTSDLAAFDNYELASAIARFPLPVIIGIGHERDTSVLDHVANMRVKTPTAAAEWLIDRVSRLMDALGRAADKIYQSASERISANRELLAHATASIPGAVKQAIMRNNNILERNAMSLATVVTSTVTTRRERLNRSALEITSAATRKIERNSERLRRLSELLEVMAVPAILKRGFTLTSDANGKILKSADNITSGSEIYTTFANGKISSVVKTAVASKKNDN